MLGCYRARAERSARPTLESQLKDLRASSIAVIIAIFSLVMSAMPTRSEELESFLGPRKRDVRVHTALFASCPGMAVAEKLGERLFTLVAWEVPMKAIKFKAVQREVAALACVVVAIPKGIDPWTGPATKRFEISLRNRPSLHIAVFDAELPARNQRMHYVALGASGFLPEGASDA
jgi:hypothetical protein